jgi:hypothetical protein
MLTFVYDGLLVGKRHMRKVLMVVGTSAITLMTAGCLGYVEDRYPPPPLPPPESSVGRPNIDQHAYNIAPRPNPHKDTAERAEANANGPNTKPAETSNATKRAPKSGEVTASTETKKNEKTVELQKPLTPAEIRAAIPVQKVSNPKQTLSSAKIKSLWGDVIGHVHSVDVSDGTVKAVDADVGKGVVRIDASRLKYVKSRNVLLTTMSKPDVARLPRVDNP